MASPAWSQPASDAELAAHLALIDAVGTARRQQSDAELAAHLAPPAVAPRLPPLLPAQGPGAPSPAVAAATARQGARQEEAAGADDLSDLAAKIKRILDEEARRHGIDV